MTYTSTEQWMKWYHNLDRDSKLLYNQARYKRKVLTQGSDYVKRERKVLPEDEKKRSLYKNIYAQFRRKGFLKALTGASPNIEQTIEWIEKAKETVVECPYCGSANPTSLDHKLPVSKGGKHEVGNFQLICHSCNMAKFTHTHDEYDAWLGQIVAHRTKG